jgi:hypothetical protein
VQQPKYIDRKRAAAQYHRDLVGVNLAKGLEISQRQRGEMLTPVEHDELELTAVLAVYMVMLNVTKVVDDEPAQARILEKARKMASDKLGVELETETT